MKKGTKKIRQVWNGNKMYYVYDLDVDEHGKRKRLYADTEEDLKKKIEEAKNNKQEELNGQIPIGSRLQDYVKFYFKNIIGKIATVKINHLIKLFSNAVFNTEIDHNMDENTEEDILRFYNQLLDKYLNVEPSCEYCPQYFDNNFLEIFCTIMIAPGISGTQIKSTVAVDQLPANPNRKNSVIGARNA